jgi:hypothetical protein
MTDKKYKPPFSFILGVLGFHVWTHITSIKGPQREYLNPPGAFTLDPAENSFS